MLLRVILSGSWWAPLALLSCLSCLPSSDCPHKLELPYRPIRIISLERNTPSTSNLRLYFGLPRVGIIRTNNLIFASLSLVYSKYSSKLIFASITTFNNLNINRFGNQDCLRSSSAGSSWTIYSHAPIGLMIPLVSGWFTMASTALYQGT